MKQEQETRREFEAILADYDKQLAWLNGSDYSCSMW